MSDNDQITYAEIETSFDYLSQEDFVNDTSGNKMSGGLYLPKSIYNRFTKLAERKKVKESTLFIEIIKHFSLKRFQNPNTVSREVYKTTADENQELTIQVEQLVKIVESLKAKNAQLKNNRSSEGWPTTPANNLANHYANNPANGLANNPANFSANGLANISANSLANGSANGLANGYAKNLAVLAENPATDQVLYQVVPLIVGYIKQVFGSDINPQQLYAWIRQNIR